jgi:biopolymer transport protein ExbD
VPVKLNHGKALSMLSLTSLIDVVFLLLIFFLVATKFAEEDKQRSLRLQLPAASEAKPLTVRPKDVIVTINETGRYFVEGREMTLQELEPYLDTAKLNNPVGQGVVFNADRRATLQAAVSLMNVCKRVGIEVSDIRTMDAAN